MLALAFKLDPHHKLCNYLIEKLDDIPIYLMKKMIDLMKQKRLSKLFYKNMKKLSTNKKLKELIEAKFPEN